jgi:hypothetical protein
MNELTHGNAIIVSHPRRLWGRGGKEYIDDWKRTTG